MSESRKIIISPVESDVKARKLSLESLPKPLLIEIFSRLPSDSFQTLILLSKFFNAFINNNKNIFSNLENLPQTLAVNIFSRLPKKSIKSLTLVSNHFHTFIHKNIFPSAYGKFLNFSSWLDSEFKAVWAATDKLKEKYTVIDAMEKSRNHTLLYGVGALFTFFYPEIKLLLFRMQKNDEIQKENSLLRQQQLKAQYPEDEQNFRIQVVWDDLGMVLVFYIILTAVNLYLPSMRQLFFQQLRANDETPLLADIVEFDRRFSMILGEDGGWLLALAPTMTVQDFLDRLTVSVLNAGCRVVDLKKELQSVTSPSRKNLDIKDVNAKIRPYASHMISFWQKNSKIPADKQLFLEPEIKEKAAKRF